MAFINCNNCGAPVEDAAKFCRQCGQPVSHLASGPRGYVSPTDYEAPTRPMNPAPTMPSYYPGQNLPPAPVPSTNELGRGSHRRTAFVLGITVGVLLIIVAALAAYITLRETESPREDITVSAPQRPGGIPVPPVPPTLPVPPPPPAVGEAGRVAKIDELMYPGAKQVMELVRSEEGNVLQLETGDSADRVAEWYAARVNVTRQLTLPGGVRLVQGQGVTVVITPGDNETTGIIIKQGLNF